MKQKMVAPALRADKTASERRAPLTADHRHLQQDLARSRTAEAVLKKSGRDCAKLLRESHQLQNHLRQLTHRRLSAQEAERKKLSHARQDEIAQTLLGIQVRLLSLKTASCGSAANLRKEITCTQRLVKDSVQSITRFAHALHIQKPA